MEGQVKGMFDNYASRKNITKTEKYALLAKESSLFTQMDHSEYRDQKSSESPAGSNSLRLSLGKASSTSRDPNALLRKKAKLEMRDEIILSIHQSKQIQSAITKIDENQENLAQ
jgi:hypothetical protein